MTLLFLICHCLNHLSSFRGAPYSTALGNTNCRVLSFNYDRLFEIAFLKHFPDFDPAGTALYDKAALNSGFLSSYDEYHLDSNDHDGFCFLKLHGSVGWWGTRQRDGGRQYCLTVPERALSLAEIEAAIPKQQIQPFDWQPLIAFPNERQASQKYEDENDGNCSDYHWHPYTRRIWTRAAALLANAVEVRVVGYSFHPIDSRFIVEKLLDKVGCEKIVLQNKLDVRRNLDSYNLRVPLEYDPTPFGE